MTTPKKTAGAPAKPKTTKKKASSAASSVDWKTAKTLTGGASRIPALITTAREEKTMYAAVNAWLDLRKSLAQGGAVAPCAPDAVTLLLDAAGSGKPGARYAMQLVGELVSGGAHHHFAHPSAPIAGPIDAVRAAVSARGDVLTSALGSDSPKLRAAAAFAAALVPDVADVTRTKLRELLPSETDDETAISFGLALGWLARGGLTVDDAAALDRARRSENAGVRAGAGLASLIAGAEDHSGLREVPAILGRSYMKVLQVEWSPWSEEEALVAIAQGQGREVELAKAFVDATDVAEGSPGKSVVGWIAAHLGDFEKLPTAVVTVEELSARARDVAIALCRFGGISDLPRALPGSVWTRRRWLGLAPGGALEKTIAHEGQQVPLWKAWRDVAMRTRTAAWPAFVLEALSPDELVEAYGEVWTRAYGIAWNVPLPDEGPVLRALPAIGERALAWAQRYVDEVGSSFVAEHWPECGHIQAMPGAPAVYLVLATRGLPLPSVLDSQFPAHVTAIAELVLRHLSAEDAERAMMAWLDVPFRASQHPLTLHYFRPLLPLVRSERVVARLTTCLEELARTSPADPTLPAAREALKAAGTA